MVNSSIFCYFRTLYFIECAIFSYCKYYSLRGGHYGAILICDDADECQKRQRTTEAIMGKTNWCDCRR